MVVGHILAVFAFAFDRVELTFAEAEGFRGDFEKLVVEEEVDTLLEGILGVRGELDSAVGGVGAHVGQLLFFADVDVEIFLFVAEANDHALVNWDTGRNEEDAAGLGGVKGIGGRGAGLEGD